MGYEQAYEKNHVDFEISDIKYEEDAADDISGTYAGMVGSSELPTTIEFKYPAPAISVDTSGRFATHEIVGGSTIRQKIGEDPVEASISGVCTEQTARQLDGLRNAEYGRIYSNRLTGGSLDVHFASVSTSPYDDAGAVDMKDNDAEFLYTFDLSVVEVNFEI